MQKDMHFAGTYVVARYAGFAHDEAATIANAAQYVDDATCSGFVRFDNGGLFQRDATCHELATPENLNDLQNHLAWLPFHFLPGNNGKPAGQGEPADHLDRLVCRENSPIAQDMVDACLEDRGLEHGLYRLGITAHVLADTFAHQGFAGMVSDVNWVSELQSNDDRLNESIATKIQNAFGRIVRRSDPMLGHGLAHSYPDLPWLEWSYSDHAGQRTPTRRNLDVFIRALDALCRMFQSYRKARGEAAEVTGLSAAAKETLLGHLDSIRDEDAQQRCDRWLALLAENAFGWGPVTLAYAADSWRREALGVDDTFEVMDKLEEIVAIHYPAGFLTSPWKRFHDAAKDHRHAVLQRILPRYGLCAA